MSIFRVKLISFILMTLIISGCAIDNNTDETYETLDYGIIYSLVFDAFILEDEGLNSDMTYIAIDVESMSRAKTDEVTYVFEQLSKYGVEVIDESFESLKSKGLVGAGNSLEGILLEVSSFELTEDGRVVVNGSKSRSGDGAIFLECSLIKVDGVWTLGYTDVKMIS